MGHSIPVAYDSFRATIPQVKQLSSQSISCWRWYIERTIVHLNVMFLFQMSFQCLALLREHSGAHLAQILVTIGAIRQMRILSKLYVNTVLFFQVLGDLLVATQETFAVFTICHGAR